MQVALEIVVDRRLVRLPQLHQIGMNLITNAYHALESTGGSISVRLEETDYLPDKPADNPPAPGRYVVLTVSDNGCGIEPSLMDHIFEPYFTTKEKDKGTGLGLSVVYGIVKEHRGDIKFYSEPGTGTTVHVYLPLMEKHIDVSPDKEEAIPAASSQRILLVDDEEPIVQLEKQMLERLGCHVTARTSSPDALAAFKATPEAFDLVISDMTMPNMMGDQLVTEIKSIRPEMPVIICTGFSERINQENAKTIGINGFLMKPVVRSDMARMIKEVLDTGSKCTVSPDPD